MFKLNQNFEGEIAEAMQQHMLSKTASVQVMSAEEQALELLARAADLFDKAGFRKDADIITAIIEKRAADSDADVNLEDEADGTIEDGSEGHDDGE